MKIAKKLFQTVCLAALFLSAGFLLYHMVYLPMENKKLVAELKGNFPEPEAPVSFLLIHPYFQSYLNFAIVLIQ